MVSPHRSLLIFAKCATGLLLLAASPLPASAQRVPSAFVEHFFGAVHLGASDMHYADDVGVRWSRNGVRWHAHQSAPDKTYDFTTSDRLFEAARTHKVRVMPVLSNLPAWASTKDDTSAVSVRHYPPTKEAISAWKDYVEAVVERHPEADYIEIWNEPNIDWFLNADMNHEAYVDRLLIPAAKVIHEHGRKVVAPSYTLEWPMDIWPPEERPARHQRNAPSAIKDLDRWLNYHDAWKHIDIVSVHYGKGDVVPHSMPYGTSMMPVYEHLYQNWIRPGRIEGVWNTEAGLTATEAGTAGFVALEPWEQPPYAQWVPRYILPVLHWALRHGWRARDQYKVFWYHIAQKEPSEEGMLRRTNLLATVADSHRVSRVGRALKTVSTLVTSADSVGPYGGRVTVGFGLNDTPQAANHFPPVRFTTYPFRVGERILVAAWLDRPGIEFGGPGQSGVEVQVEGPRADRAYTVERIDYVSGARSLLATAMRPSGETLQLNVPRTGDPILYLMVRPTAAE